MCSEIVGKRILVTGAQGMLAGDLLPLLQEQGAELLLADVVAGARYGLEVQSVDISDAKVVGEVVAAFKPQWIVNCAAYTKVDDAEKDYRAAFAVNAVGPANMARSLLLGSGCLLHISTDYVFGGSPGGGEARVPIAEDAVPDPCGIYGQSKRFGDELVCSVLPARHLILRTSWLHGVHGPNFVDTMLRLGRERGELQIVDDQVGSPTWTGWLVLMIVEMLRREARGTYNVSSRGNISWYDFAEEIFRQAGLSVKLGRQTTEQLGRPAPRPRYSTLALGKLEDFLGVSCLDWKDSVREHLSAREVAV